MTNKSKQTDRQTSVVIVSISYMTVHCNYGIALGFFSCTILLNKGIIKIIIDISSKV